MLSLKSLLENRDVRSLSTMERVAAILLDCMGVYCVPCCESHAAPSRVDIRALRARTQGMDNDAAILLVGDAVRAIQKYTSAAEACLSAQKQQMSRICPRSTHD